MNGQQCGWIGGLTLPTSSRPHPPRADGASDGWLNTLRFNTAQDPIRLARMVNEMRIAAEEAAGPIETTDFASCFRSFPPFARGGWGCGAYGDLFLAHDLCAPIRASRMGSWRCCPGLLKEALYDVRRRIGPKPRRWLGSNERWPIPLANEYSAGVRMSEDS